MNAIIVNNNKDIISNLDIDVNKRLEGEYSAEEIIKTFTNFYFNKMFIDVTAIKDYQDVNNMQKIAMNLNADKIILLLNEDPACNSNLYISRLISMGIYNFTKNIEGLKYLYEHPNSYKDVAHLHQLENITTQLEERIITKNLRILGIRNLTSHAGSTSLIYMLKKQLSLHYFVVAIEVNKRDFIFYNDKDMISTTSIDLASEIMKNKDADIILIDLNDYNDDSICNDVLYLIEPSTLMLNKLVMINRDIFNKIKDKKIVLNKSLLNSKDILDFEFESQNKVYYNLPPMDDKKDNSNILLPFLNKLGFVEKVEIKEENNAKVFGLFKF